MSRNVRSIPWKVWERISAWSLLAFAAALLLTSKRLAVSYQLGLWGLWIVVLAILFRRGWIRLFGPVLFYDLIRTGRRTRNILLRCLYSLALLLVLYTVYLEFSERVQMLERMAFANNVSAQIAQEMGKFAESFFIMFMEVQFVGIFLLTPAFAAGAIAEEKDRRTLEYLLATDLDNREIVLGKLVSRVLGLMLLVLTGLPILSLIQFFGGVDPDLVISGFAATGLTMLSLAGLSILNSVYTKKPRDAIVLTYLIVAAYLGFSAMSRWLIAKPRIGAAPIIPETWSDLLEWFSSGNLFVIVHKLREAQGTGLLLQNVLPTLLGNYALVHGLLALTFVFWAVVRLRVVAQNEIIRRPRKNLRRLWSWRWLPVRRKPMLWKELHLEARLGFNRLGRFVIILIALASFLPALWIGYEELPHILQGGGWDSLERAVNQWVRTVGTIVASLILLGVGLRAAGAISGERERQTLDSLLTSPLVSQEIVMAKWWGSLWSVRWAWLWLCAIWGLGILTGGMEAACLPWLMMAWCVYAGFMAALGLYLSTVHSQTQRASIWMLTISVCLYGLPMIFSYLLKFLNPVTRMGGGSFLGDLLGHLEYIGMVPPVALNWLAFRQYDLDLSFIHAESPMGVLVGIAVGLAVWAGLTWWFLKMTIRRFNLQTGRRKVVVFDETFEKHYPEFRPVTSSEYFP
jgi:ABC-type transport system involved in multi-copper enzyme maturation permease subunit